MASGSHSQSAPIVCAKAFAPFKSARLASSTPLTQQEQSPLSSMAAADSSARRQSDSAVQGDDEHPSATYKTPECLHKEREEAAQQEEAEAHKVHEITESSSDESSDEEPSRSHCTTSNSSEQDSLGAEAVAATVEDEEEEKSPKMPAPEVVEEMRSGVYMPEPEVVYNTKNVADMHYLFTNDKLKEESPAVVLRSDPFCIPRVTDNVPNYRPMLNPLSIFLGEDKLLPGNFRLDPTERLPNVGGNVTSKKDATTGPRGISLLPGSSSSSTSSGKQFRGKTSAFMGTMPRQTEFAEIPVSEKLFQNHEVFRPSPPIPRVPASPSRDLRSVSGMDSETTSRQFTRCSSESEASTSSSGTNFTKPSASASLSDAMLLSSIQHTLDATTGALAATDCAMHPVDATESASSSSDGNSASSGYQIQSLQPLESVADRFRNYLPNRSSSTPDNSRPMDGQYFDAPGGYNSVGVSMGYGTDSPAAQGTFGSLLSPVENHGNTPYSGLFIDSGGAHSVNQSMQNCSSALGSISLTTPTSGAVGIHSGLITPQGAARSGEDTPRRQGAKKPRAKNVFRPCTAPGCTKGARGKSGLCQKHGGGKRCAAPNCPKGAQGSSSMCLFHGGGYRCTVEGCTTGARGTSGLCAKHGGYKKAKRGPNADGAAAKRVRTDEPQYSPASVKAD